MVLLKGLPWTVPPCPALDARSADEFYIEKTTGAVYRDYPSYLHAVQLLKARVWGSICTGAGNLTFEEASMADAHCSELGTKVRLRSPRGLLQKPDAKASLALASWLASRLPANSTQHSYPHWLSTIFPLTGIDILCPAQKSKES